MTSVWCQGPFDVQVKNNFFSKTKLKEFESIHSLLPKSMHEILTYARFSWCIVMKLFLIFNCCVHDGGEINVMP